MVRTTTGVDDGCIFDDHLCAAWMYNGDDFANYQRLCEADAHTDLIGVREQTWNAELERKWPAIKQIAEQLLAGNTVTDAVVRELVEGVRS